MGHGGTKGERIKLDFIWETLINVSAPFRSTTIAAVVASGSLSREKNSKKEEWLAVWLTILNEDIL